MLAQLSSWADETRTADAVASRAREAWLRRQAEETATWRSLLESLAEQGALVTAVTSAGRRHHGRLTGVARDFVLLASSRGDRMLLAMHAVSSLQRAPGAVGHPARTGGLAPSAGPSLAEALARLAEERPRVRVSSLGSGDPVVGSLLSCGTDVATVRLEGAPPSMIYVRVDSISEVSLLSSG